MRFKIPIKPLVFTYLYGNDQDDVAILYRQSSWIEETGTELDELAWRFVQNNRRYLHFLNELLGLVNTQISSLNEFGNPKSVEFVEELKQTLYNQLITCENVHSTMETQLKRLVPETHTYDVLVTHEGPIIVTCGVEWDGE